MTRVRAGREIHRGGMASIHEAMVEGLGGVARKVALKRIVEPMPETVERFLDEIRVLSHLSHPGIVHLLGAGEEEGLPYLLLELVDGLDLARLLERAKEELAEDIALFIVREIAWTLAHVHRATDDEGAPLGIVHRDVSCENIMIGWDGTVRLIDFGIASSNDKKSKTAVGRALGKRKYMAPELDDGTSDPRTDLFALGRVLAELTKEDASAATRAIIERACQPEPQRRHASAEQFAADCSAALASLGSVDPRPRLIEWLAPLRERKIEKMNDLLDPFLAPPEPRQHTIGVEKRTAFDEEQTIEAQPEEPTKPLRRLPAFDDGATDRTFLQTGLIDQQKTKNVMRSARRPYVLGAIGAALAVAVVVLMPKREVEPLVITPGVEPARAPTAFAIEKSQPPPVEPPRIEAEPPAKTIARPLKSTPPKLDLTPWRQRFNAALRASRLDREEVDPDVVKNFESALTRHDEAELTAAIEALARLAPSAEALLEDLAHAKTAIGPAQEAEYLDLREAIDRAASPEARRSLRDRIRALRDSR